MPRDDRTYITLHDGMPDHPKIDPLSDAAFRLLVSMWCWCSRNETDGRVPAATWAKRGTLRVRRELVEAGLVEVHGDKVEMHDYLEHQRSAAEIAELRRKRREAGSKGGKAKATATASAKATATANGQQDDGKPVADTETERTRHSSSSEARKRATKIPQDWTPDLSLIAWQRDQGIPDDLARRELPRFRDYWLAAAGERGRKLDWDATWRNWLRTAMDRATGTAQRRAVNDDDPMGWAK